jgi:hypothetical protein
MDSLRQAGRRIIILPLKNRRRAIFKELGAALATRVRGFYRQFLTDQLDLILDSPG